MNQLIISIVFTLLSLVACAQTPQAFNYQAVARDNAGIPIPNRAVSIRISILQGSPNGTSVYTETFSPSTNKVGLFNLQIGTGTVQSGIFANINWGSSTFYSRVEMDPSGGTNFTVLGTSQMLSVPYALYAKKVESESQSLSLSGNTLSISSGNSVVLPTTALQAGAGISISGNTITNTALSNIVSVSAANMNSIRPQAGSVATIVGSLSLSALYSNMEESNLTILGGTINGNGQTLRLGNYTVVTGVVFNNVNITGLTCTFEGCTFNNVTQIPDKTSFSGCQFNNCNVSSNNVGGFINNSTLLNTTIPRIWRITNSIVNNSTVGTTSYHVSQVSNCEITSSYIYLSGSFTGNLCDETQVLARNSLNSVEISSNRFIVSSSALSTDIINVDLNTSGRFTANISNNNFIGNSTYPNGQYIRVYGTYTGTRSITKISNNNVVGGTARFISAQYTGSSDLMVNDNDLLYTGGLGVTTGGFIYTRNNITH